MDFSFDLDHIPTRVSYEEIIGSPRRVLSLIGGVVPVSPYPYHDPPFSSPMVDGAMDIHTIRSHHALHHQQPFPPLIPHPRISARCSSGCDAASLDNKKKKTPTAVTNTTSDDGDSNIPT